MKKLAQMIKELTRFAMNGDPVEKVFKISENNDSKEEEMAEL